MRFKLIGSCKNCDKVITMAQRFDIPETEKEFSEAEILNAIACKVHNEIHKCSAGSPNVFGLVEPFQIIKEN